MAALWFLIPSVLAAISAAVYGGFIIGRWDTRTRTRRLLDARPAEPAPPVRVVTAPATPDAFLTEIQGEGGRFGIRTNGRGTLGLFFAVPLDPAMREVLVNGSTTMTIQANLGSSEARTIARALQDGASVVDQETKQDDKRPTAWEKLGETI